MSTYLLPKGITAGSIALLVVPKKADDVEPGNYIGAAVGLDDVGYTLFFAGGDHYFRLAPPVAATLVPLPIELGLNIVIPGKPRTLVRNKKGHKPEGQWSRDIESDVSGFAVKAGQIHFAGSKTRVVHNHGRSKLVSAWRFKPAFLTSRAGTPPRDSDTTEELVTDAPALRTVESL